MRSFFITEDLDYRTKVGFKEAWVSIIGNIFLFLVKIFLGIMVNSIAVIADAWNSLSDVLTSIVVLVGFRISHRPPDELHPYGHGRMETISTLVIAIGLFIVSFGLINTSVMRVFRPPRVLGSWVVVVIMGMSAVFKEWMARYAFRLARDINSSTLKADAWHHRSDALGAVLAGIGVFAARFRLYRVDAVLGIIISLFLVYIAWLLLKSSGSSLLGEAPSSDFFLNIEKVARVVAGVEGIHDITAHQYGNYWYVGLHIEVKGHINLEEAHRIADEVEQRLWKELRVNALVHVDVKPTTKPYSLPVVIRLLSRVSKKFSDAVSFHRAYLVTTEDGHRLDFHLVVPHQMSVEAAHNLSHRITSHLERLLKDCWVHIHIEPCKIECRKCRLEKCEERVE